MSGSTRVSFLFLLPAPLRFLTSFVADVWTPLLPFLPTNVRFVAYNQRGYTGSSPAFEIKEEGGVDAAGAYLSDTMEFFRFVVDELGAKKVEDGGVVLLVGLSQCYRLSVHSPF